jgi:2-polyprenyl-6-methoxyphenol hydroxylase-like FAD-dependent oxidoreductase
MKKFFFTFLLITAIYFLRAESIVIIGGGPVGLATAIEAAQNGAETLVIEKRKNSSRWQVLILLESSLKLLEKWDVRPPELKVISLQDETRIGIVAIHVLERALERKAQELGVKKIEGEFIELFKEDKKIMVSLQEGVESLTYNLLVAADGTHSLAKEKLNIASQELGRAKAAIAVIPRNQQQSSLGVIPYELSQKAHYVGIKIMTPRSVLISLQVPLSAEEDFDTLFKEVAAEYGWEEEKEALKQGKAELIHPIDVRLSQAESFSDEEACAILVGDAAATASFIKGRGVNTGFLSAEAAGRLFREYREDKNAYQRYNQRIKEITDELIQDSASLFAKEEKKENCTWTP